MKKLSLLFAALFCLISLNARTLYLQPTGNTYGGWAEGNERYAIYFFGDGSNTDGWISMEKVANDASTYQATIDDKWPKVIFCRMNGTSTDNNWDNKWNQSADLILADAGEGNNCYTMPGATWSKYTPAATPTVSYVLNGGTATPIPADNEALWALFKPAYNAYYKLDRADQPLANVATFASAKMKDFLTDESSAWKWLGDYIISLIPALATEADGTGWRFTVQGFFNCHADGFHWAQKGDWKEAGKPENWLSACPWTAFDMTPTKTGYKFTGWYSDEACTTLVTKLPESGTLYAGWEKIQGSKFYLVGFINGADYSDNAYQFKNDTVTVAITAESYVVVKDEYGYWYMTEGWAGDVASVTLHTTVASANKLKVPAGTWVFTLTYNGDTTYTLSYEKPSETTNLSNATLNQVKARKIVENGQIYILRDGLKYNIFGALVD